MTAQDFLSHTVILYVRTESALEPWPLRAPQEVKPLKSFLYHRRGVDHPGLVLADANSLPGTWGSARWPLLLLEEWWLKVGSVFCIQGSSLCLDVKDKCVMLVAAVQFLNLCLVVLLDTALPTMMMTLVLWVGYTQPFGVPVFSVTGRRPANPLVGLWVICYWAVQKE